MVSETVLWELISCYLVKNLCILLVDKKNVCNGSCNKDLVIILVGAWAVQRSCLNRENCWEFAIHDKVKQVSINERNVSQSDPIAFAQSPQQVRLTHYGVVLLQPWYP